MSKKFSEVGDSLADLQTFETVDEEYAHWKSQLHKLDAEFSAATSPRERNGIKHEINQVRSKLGQLKPHLKHERRTLHGKPIDQRTRHDVMEDMLLELREIRRLLTPPKLRDLCVLVVN